MMQVSKKIPFEDPNVLMGVRALYIVSNLLIAGIYFYTKMQIDKKRGMCTHYTLARVATRALTNILISSQT
jgi:hypothetical protein